MRCLLQTRSVEAAVWNNR